MFVDLMNFGFSIKNSLEPGQMLMDDIDGIDRITLSMTQRLSLESKNQF